MAPPAFIPMRPLLLLLIATGCATPSADPGVDCSEDRCVHAGSKDELLAQLSGFGDPVASFLRSAATERGTIAGDYRTILDGAGANLGCDASTEHTFVVLSNQDFV